MLPVGNTRRFWETRAAMLAARLNVGTWLERFAPVFFGVTSLGAVAVYALRRMRGTVALGWGGLAAVVALAALVVLWLARRRFFSAAEARVLLESQLKLDTRLTAASEGWVSWPAADTALPAIVHWRLRSLSGWFVGALLLLLLAARAPVPELSSLVHPTEKPPSLAQTEAMLAALAQAKVADQSAVEQMAERARELANRSTDQQYSHSALEAADALRDQTAAAVSALSRNLDAAASALKAAEKDPTMKASAGQLAAALSGLREGSLPANADLMKQLAANGASPRELSADQMKDLAKQLANASQRAKGVLGAAGAGAGVAKPDPDAQGQAAMGGPGGEGGGETSAPLTMGRDGSDAGDGKMEALSPSDLRNLALGDKLGTTSGKHDVDPNKVVGPTSAGAVATPAKGGEAVWVNRLTPAERTALKDFYK